MVHHYERYAWIVILIVMLFLWGLGGKAGYDISAQNPIEDTGKSLSADILSFGGIVFGSFTGVGAISSIIFYHINRVSSGHPLLLTIIVDFLQTRLQ